MKKERMAILKMVNDGKITADEAVKLLESLKDTKSIDAGDVIDCVKEKVCEVYEEAKPVVKKYAGKAKEAGSEVYSKGKAKVQEYKAKSKSSDYIDVDEVIIEPVKDAAEDIKDTVKDTAEEIKDNISDKQ